MTQSLPARVIIDRHILTNFSFQDRISTITAMFFFCNAANETILGMQHH